MQAVHFRSTISLVLLLLTGLTGAFCAAQGTATPRVSADLKALYLFNEGGR